MKFMVMNGPNLNMLGIREPEIYGKDTYEDLKALVRAAADERGVEVEFYQSNHEGDLVDKIQEAFMRHFDGIVINPAAYTHTSVALLDAVKAAKLPTVEVHISDVSKRDDFRQVSYIREACVATVMGRGFQGYVDAMDILIDKLGSKACDGAACQAGADHE
ncbi:MAG: type II 3-dehydroquinate dehydratase [Eubacteriales bacterium]|nr:type II 3-dehydroquinate dehydratase [Eubacteriales bacterium]